MPLKPGTLLGPYDIVALIGMGGMGEVYKARDPRLEREVAIKVLPAELASKAKWSSASSERPAPSPRSIIPPPSRYTRSSMPTAFSF